MTEPAHDGPYADEIGRRLLEDQERLLERIRLMMGPAARRHADSVDFLQATLQAALSAPTRAPLGDRTSLLRWLTAVARNQIRSSLRRERERSFDALSVQLDPEAGERTPSSEFGRWEERLRLAEALEGLRAEDRRVIELRHLEGLPFEAVGTRLERSAEAARKLHARAIYKLGGALRRAPD